jgi:hypothetical protein
VYLDESGFEPNTYRPYAWSKRGKKSYGERSGKRSTRTSLIAAKRGKQLYQFSKVTGDLVNIDCRYTTISVL